MYRAVLRAARNCRIRSGAHVLCAIALGARSFSEVAHDTGLSSSTTAAALHSLEDLGLVEHDGEAWALRRAGFAIVEEFDEIDYDAPRTLWSTSNSEAPCHVDALAGMATSNFEAQQQPAGASKSELLHSAPPILDPELAQLADEIRKLSPHFNPRPEETLEAWVLHWEDRRHRMRQNIAYLRDPENLAKVRNVSAWIRSAVEKNWAPLRNLDQPTNSTTRARLRA